MYWSMHSAVDPSPDLELSQLEALPTEVRKHFCHNSGLAEYLIELGLGETARAFDSARTSPGHERLTPALSNSPKHSQKFVPRGQEKE